MDLRETLLAKIMVLNQAVWEHRVGEPQLEEWLGNFGSEGECRHSEALHALFMLRQFMYFGSRELRELLRALYRDLFKYPIVAELRKRNGHTRDSGVLEELFRQELERTRFMALGNPSESGCHLLYYFRQENDLPRGLFINTHEVFTRGGHVRPTRSRFLDILCHAASIITRWGYRRPTRLRFPDVSRYVLVDDLCASGDQATMYSEELVVDMKALRPDVKVCYYALFATSEGLDAIRNNADFDVVDAVFELDASFRAFGENTRLFQGAGAEVNGHLAEHMSRHYGSRLFPEDPLGYGDSQLLLGFHHNTPDNTLPIFWSDKPTVPWTPLFRRYPKKYGWGAS